MMAKVLVIAGCNVERYDDDDDDDGDGDGDDGDF